MPCLFELLILYLIKYFHYLEAFVKAFMSYLLKFNHLISLALLKVSTENVNNDKITVLLKIQLDCQY